MAIRPLDDRVVIQPLEAEEKHRVELFCLIQQKKNQQKVRLFLWERVSSWIAEKEPHC